MLTPSQQSFLTSAALASVQSQSVYGVPAELTLPQALEESGWGKSAPYNNCLGIKANGRGIGTFVTPTQEFVGGHWITVELAFERYASLKACFDDHGWLISHGSPYKAAWLRYNASHDIPTLIMDVGHVYATAPAYADAILALSQQTNVMDALKIARASVLGH